MAITDRNLSVGTKLWARYKGATHTADVVDVEGSLKYRLPDGREFKSPSAAGTAITEKACNGWSFWTVGEPVEKEKPAETEPKRTTRTRQAKQPPAADGNGKALPIIERLDGQFECGECQEVFVEASDAEHHFQEKHAPTA